MDTIVRNLIKEIGSVASQIDETKDLIKDLQKKLSSETGADWEKDRDSIMGKIHDLDTRLSIWESRIAGEDGVVGQLRAYERRLRELEQGSDTFRGKWAIISLIGAAILSGVIGLLFSMAKAAEPGRALPQQIQMIIPEPRGLSTKRD